ncbi:MAG: MFS transporter [Betaproteobacteria bacterium]|jgi:MFS family permease|nr:MFS transporter [Betaproteobacteria bacterium]
MSSAQIADAPQSRVESPYAWVRLLAALMLSTLGGVGMWSVVVVLPAVQAEFDVARGAASLPYTLTMVGFGLGGVLMGRLSDRFGVMVPVIVGSIALSVGMVAAGTAGNLWLYAIAQGLLVGVGSSATFGPLVADVSFWFTRRRGIAVAICASGNYVAGAIWPPVVQHFIETDGWRATNIGIGIFCVVAMLPLALILKRPVPILDVAAGTGTAAGRSPLALGLSPAALQTLLVIAGVACCVAMSMPQVHIVALCSDRGFGAARGAQMLSLMLGFGIVSRLVSGVIADRIGGVRTLLLGSTLQGVALVLYLGSEGLVSLYVVSALFGLFQGGIVPSYALIVREFFSPREAGARIGTVIMATLFGMALGGWMSGAIFDLTGSYDAAFVNGIIWNLLNVSIAAWLLVRSTRRYAHA